MKRNMNFRQTKSERSATGSYSNFKKGQVKNLKNLKNNLSQDLKNFEGGK